MERCVRWKSSNGKKGIIRQILGKLEGTSANMKLGSFQLCQNPLKLWLLLLLLLLFFLFKIFGRKNLGQKISFSSFIISFNNLINIRFNIGFNIWVQYLV